MGNSPHHPNTKFPEWEVAGAIGDKMSLFKSKNLDDWTQYKGMVHWFSPMVLFKTLEQVIPSTLFEKYADGRLIHAALDAIAPDSIIETCCGGAKGLCGDNNGPFWVDYVADLGDGFDSTYAIAYLIGQQQLEVSGETLPRADCLIMGGDEVYPDASREDYHSRMQRPYRAAFPKTNRAGAKHPPVFLLPGNHDWYDGLKLFLALFCSGHTDLGSWVASQRRSYFATHLGHNWWIWGFDSQLDEDVDKPQSDYFDAVAKGMEPNAKVILCASVPTWLKADLALTNDAGRERFYRGVHFIASKLYTHCADVKVPLLLSGDTHHYNRYVANGSGPHFITAGGGGAFLHPTHDVIEDAFQIMWLDGKQVTMEIGLDGSDKTKKAIYPPQNVSRRFALGNLLFWYKNWDFCLVLGFLYTVCAFLLLAAHGYGNSDNIDSLVGNVWTKAGSLWPTPVFLVVVIILLVLLHISADIRSTFVKRLVVSLHALVHIGIILFGTSLVSTILSLLHIRLLPVGEILYFLALAAGMLVLGFLGGLVWGSYLTLASWLWGDEPNNAFSAMRLDSYKHFLRIKIEKNTLTIYPIGIDNVPSRSDWKINEKFNENDPDQNTPFIVPLKDLGQHLIEAPIIINVDI
jgi:hypothetical protein